MSGKVDEQYRGYLRERLKDISFPAHLIVHAPERNYRTTYRRENSGCFGECQCENLEEAVVFIDGLGYQGLISEMSIYRVTGLEEV